jgi:hypothetical protein
MSCNLLLTLDAVLPSSGDGALLPRMERELRSLCEAYLPLISASTEKCITVLPFRVSAYFHDVTNSLPKGMTLKCCESPKTFGPALLDY